MEGKQSVVMGEEKAVAGESNDVGAPVGSCSRSARLLDTQDTAKSRKSRLGGAEKTQGVSEGWVIVIVSVGCTI
jgi:hypothetical protein